MLTLVRKQKTTIDTLELDASLTETHAAEVEVTDHPVEQGANISDHRRVKPRSVTIEGLISNTPMPKDGDPVRIVPVGSAAGAQTRSAGDPTRTADALEKLNELLLSSELIDIVTALTSYENMTMTSLSIPRDAKSGQALRFTASFREIRIVRNDTVTIQAKTTRAKPQVDQHKQTKTESADDDTRTRALKLVNHIQDKGAVGGFVEFLSSGGN